MTKFLIIGFGNMGCRHTQSLMTIPNSLFDIYEPSEEVFKVNCQRIGISDTQVNRLHSIDELNSSYEFAVVATSAEPRYSITKSLIKNGIKSILLEKVVFQSEKQFNEICELALQNKVDIRCNFVNRYFPNYKHLKHTLKDKNFKMSVVGGEFGLACNGLHYFDLFEYLSGSNSEIISFDLKKSETSNQRGNQYVEVTGSLLSNNNNGCSFNIISDNGSFTGVKIIIESENRTDILDEYNLFQLTVSNGSKNLENFNILYTSSLTKIIYEDMKNQTCLLPSIFETKNIHCNFYKAINSTLGISLTENCPIT